MPNLNYGLPMEEYGKGRGSETRNFRRLVFGFGTPKKFVPSDLPSLAAWFRFGAGLTDDGAGLCSNWADQSGNGRDLKATTTARPTIQADKSVLFDGSANFMKCDAFTLNQPETVYFLIKQITWGNDLRFCDGNSNFTMLVNQQTATPQISMYATGAQVANNSNLALNTWGVVAAVFNGASSSLQVNNTTATTGYPGAGNAGGFTLGANSDGAGGWSNIQVKEVILYAAAHTADQRTQVINYLTGVGSL